MDQHFKAKNKLTVDKSDSSTVQTSCSSKHSSYFQSNAHAQTQNTSSACSSSVFESHDDIQKSSSIGKISTVLHNKHFIKGKLESHEITDGDDVVIIKDTPQKSWKTEHKKKEQNKGAVNFKSNSDRVKNEKKSIEDVICIPETQIIQETQELPNNSICNQFGKGSSSAQPTHDNDDSLILPDTPDAALSRSMAGKKKVYRSFLSSTSLTANPPVKILNSTQLKNKIAMQKAQQKNTRSFEDAYKEMMNAKAEATGEKLEKADISFVMNSMGMPLTSPTDTNLSQPHKNSVSSEKSNKSDSKRKCGTVGALSGIKRSSSHGESPNSKRFHRQKSATPGKKVDDKNSKDGRECRRKLTLDCDKKETGSKKSKTWENDVNLCENDNVLEDILNEMKSECGQMKKRKSLEKKECQKVVGSTEHNDIPLTSELGSLKDNKVPLTLEVESSMDTDVDDALDDIMHELKQNTYTQSKEVKKYPKPTANYFRKSSSGLKIGAMASRLKGANNKNGNVEDIERTAQIEISEFNTQIIAKENMLKQETIQIESDFSQVNTMKDLRESVRTDYPQQDLVKDFSHLSPFKKQHKQWYLL